MLDVSSAPTHQPNHLSWQGLARHSTMVPSRGLVP